MLVRTFVGLSLAAAAHLGAQIDSAEYAARRTALAASIGDGVLVALGAPEPAADYESFFQIATFDYLTGVREPDAALVMVKHDGHTTSTLFVQPANPDQEVWSGHRMGPAGATAVTGLAARPVTQLKGTLDSLLGHLPPATATLYVVGTEPTGSTTPGTPLTADAQFVRRVVAGHPRVRVIDATPMELKLRGTKSAAELALIRKAVTITADAEQAAFHVVGPGVNEFEVQAEIEYVFRRDGADRPSFASIIGSGPNATTLHYNADDRFMEAGDLVVMDIGASYRGYAGDVTRTVPVNGTYSADQRAIYQIVRDAQAAAERQATVGAPSRLMNDSATAVLAAGLARLGLIESPEATYDCGPRQQCFQYTLYYMHGLGHGIGLDVHDPDQFYYTARIGPGSAFTIEPGLYVRAALPSILPDTPRNRALLTVIGPAITRYANIGVRIEDDYIATAQGVEWVSRAPREASEIEAAMRDHTPPTAGRDTVKVDWYRKKRD
jgi:Xaa-Pro aminopeptidase